MRRILGQESRLMLMLCSVLAVPAEEQARDDRGVRDHAHDRVGAVPRRVRCADHSHSIRALHSARPGCPRSRRARLHARRDRGAALPARAAGPHAAALAARPSPTASRTPSRANVTESAAPPRRRLCRERGAPPGNEHPRAGSRSPSFSSGTTRLRVGRGASSRTGETRSSGSASSPTRSSPR